MSRCLFCYRELDEHQVDFHPACAKRFFGMSKVPALDYTIDQLDQLAEQIIRRQTTLTGVQPKLSLHLQQHHGNSRLTIVGLWGDFICKPQSGRFQMLPEVEDLTMHLAEIARLAVVPHTLMRMADNSLCYLTRRVDRTGGRKIPMEDMCQITERPTEYKYHGSYERIAGAIGQHSVVPKLDVVTFFEIVLFSWLTGNNDMHLKNFSLYEPQPGVMRLAPAYDLLNCAIVNPDDNEEMALTLAGRKRNITRNDFLEAAQTMGIERNIVVRIIKKYAKLQSRMTQMIHSSFIDGELQERYINLLGQRLSILTEGL